MQSYISYKVLVRLFNLHWAWYPVIILPSSPFLFWHKYDTVRTKPLPFRRVCDANTTIMKPLDPTLQKRQWNLKTQKWKTWINRWSLQHGKKMELSVQTLRQWLAEILVCFLRTNSWSGIHLRSDYHNQPFLHMTPRWENEKLTCRSYTTEVSIMWMPICPSIQMKLLSVVKKLKEVMNIVTHLVTQTISRFIWIIHPVNSLRYYFALQGDLLYCRYRRHSRSRRLLSKTIYLIHYY